MALFGRKSHSPAPRAKLVALNEPHPHRSTDEQLAIMLESVEPLRPFGMQINDVSGLTLCEDIVSDIDLPMLTTASVDGYAVRSSDTAGATQAAPADLVVTGVAQRRDVLPLEALPEGGCILVSTGAPVAEGVDAVVPLTDVVRDGQVVSIPRQASVHEGLSVRGSALADGDKLLTADTVLDPLSIGVLAEIGLDKVLVRPRPRVVVFAVGARLIAPGLPITGVGQSYSAQTALLAAASRADGATVYALDAVPPDAKALRQAIHDQSIRADLMLILAATDTDAHLAGGVLAELGPVDRAWVSLDGGREIATGRLGDDQTPVVVLPGTPVAAYVAHRLLIRPLIERLFARDAPPLPRVRRRAAAALDGGEGVRHVPVLLNGEEAVELGATGGFACDLYRADALAEVPASGIAAGAEVDCLLLESVVTG